MNSQDTLAILAFDHRGAFSRAVFNRDPHLLSPKEFDQLAASKTLAFEGFLSARPLLPPSVHGGILADEEFAVDVLLRSQDRDFVMALPVEQADQTVFQFDYGEDFLEHISRFSPDYAKALVRLNVHDEAEATLLQLRRLKRLSTALRSVGVRFMFELVVTPSMKQLSDAGESRREFEDHYRPAAVIEAMRLIQESGIWVDMWKLEGIMQPEHAEAVVAQAHAANPDATCIVLGAAAESHRIDVWLDVGAKTPGFNGFAFGRSVWASPLQSWVSGQSDSAETIQKIADSYLHFVNSYMDARDH